jgi:hypothetical protein
MLEMESSKNQIKSTVNHTFNRQNQAKERILVMEDKSEGLLHSNNNEEKMNNFS